LRNKTTATAATANAECVWSHVTKASIDLCVHIMKRWKPSNELRSLVCFLNDSSDEKWYRSVDLQNSECSEHMFHIPYIRFSFFRFRNTSYAAVQ